MHPPAWCLARRAISCGSNSKRLAEEAQLRRPWMTSAAAATTSAARRPLAAQPGPESKHRIPQHRGEVCSRGRGGAPGEQAPPTDEARRHQ